MLTHRTKECRKKKAYWEARQRRSQNEGKVKEVRDGMESQDTADTTSETEEESEREGSTNWESPEGIERLEEELDVLPGFLKLGVRE